MISSDVSFKGRQQVIRDAQWIAKTAHNAFPHLSSTMFDIRSYDCNKYCMKFCDSFDVRSCNETKPPYFCFLTRANRKLEERAKEARRRKFPCFEGMSPFQFSFNIVERMRRLFFANCSESATFAEIIARMNGIKDVQTAYLLFGSRDLDHVVTIIGKNRVYDEGHRLVMKGKEAIVVDPWLGIADYVGNYINLIKHKYNHIFELMPDEKSYIVDKDRCKVTIEKFKSLRKANNPGKEIRFEMYNPILLDYYDISKLKRFYPQLIFNGNNNRRLFEKR